MTMTREEAINRFKGIRESFSISIAQSKFYPSKAELNELCDMAIESLSAEPSGDLIIKNGKGIQDGLYNIKDGELFKYKAKGGTVRAYKLVPSADRPRGEWLDREDSADAFFLYKYECSLCGGKAVFNSTYCPNCGAKMIGE